ncbi:MAG: hypothetical protein R2769_05965 [Saprospiraceae bacterium]
MFARAILAIVNWLRLLLQAGRLCHLHPIPDLAREQIDIITKWVAQGAQDNSCDNGCDTTNVTFSGTIAPIMNIYCVGCHGGGNPQGNISLTNYAEVKTYAANGKINGFNSTRSRLCSNALSGWSEPITFLLY